MVSLRDYAGREQSYVKHVFIESYLERLIHKTASTFLQIAYIDGFAGPWQSSNERFEDTSFGIALNALQRAKSSWKATRDVRMSAFLVERDESAYQRLTSIAPRYPDIAIKTYPAKFLTVLPNILRDIPNDAFSFFLIDPKGWRIKLHELGPMLKRRNSEIVFNFMFDFINRAASIKDPTIVNGLDELIPYGSWRTKLDAAERNQFQELDRDARKFILVGAFAESLARLGNYAYVAETTVLRPLADRPLYCLVYATRHSTGIEVFRDSQIKALTEQSRVRAATKVERTQTSTGQKELFRSLHEMAPDELDSFMRDERIAAEISLFGLIPSGPDHAVYKDLWPRILARHVVKRADVNKLAVKLQREGRILFLDWERGKRVPQPEYRCQRV